MTIHRLWTLCIVGEPEEGGTPCLRQRVPEEFHDDPRLRSAVENTMHIKYAAEHPGHVIASEWWACEEREVRD